MQTASRISITDSASAYFKRFEGRPPILSVAPASDTIMIIVIPCYDEPDLLVTLRSLQACYPPRFPVEVIVVVNESEDALPDIGQRNQRTVNETRLWIKEQLETTLNFHLIYVADLPAKHAGVGLARKIGMDEALRRLATIPYDGWIVCLDADCEVEANYLRVLERTFLERHPNSATIYFEHNVEAVTDPILRAGITHYELFLRYYVAGLRYADFPFAMHTVGSSMAVRATLYARTGGMNRRRAGEDFYFLHKLAPHGGLEEVTETTVYPSARLSQRVPFGTGRAQAEWQQGGRRSTYHPVIFEELKTFFSFAKEEYRRSDEETSQALLRLPGLLPQFLQQQQYGPKVAALKANTSQQETFERRFFAWFDGFTVLKYVHYAGEHGVNLIPLPEAARVLLKNIGQQFRPSDPDSLLRIYRKLDQTTRHMGQ